MAFAHAAQLLSTSVPSPERGTGDGKTSRSKKANLTTTRASSSPPANSEGSDDAEGVPDADEFYENLVKHTHVDREVLEDLLNYTPAKITLNVTGRQLGATLKQKQIAVGVLLSVAYQYGLGRSTTSVSVIREECTRLRGVDDNLSTYLRGTSGIRLVGDGRIKDIQLRDAALDLFKAEAERITGIPGATE